MIYTDKGINTLINKYHLAIQVISAALRN